MTTARAPSLIDVATLYDPAIVDTRHEAANIVESVDQGTLLTQQTFPSVSEWIEALAHTSAALLPELRNYGPSSSLTADHKSAIRSFVEAGGNLVSATDSWERNHDLLNDVFGWSSSRYYSSGAHARQPGADSTCFDEALGSPSALPHLSYTTYSRAADLPDGSTVLYGNGGSYASAWSVEVGEGTVYMLAYDWSGGRNAEWEWVLGAALSCNFPTISLDGTRSEVGFPETTPRTGSVSRTTVPAQASSPLSSEGMTTARAPSLIDVATLYDPAIVDTRHEAANIVESVDQGTLLTQQTFPSVSEWIEALAHTSAALLPELRNYGPSSSLTADHKSAIRSFVEAGGNLVSATDSWERNHDLLNDVFGWSSSRYYSSGAHARQPGADSTCFDEALGSPSALPHLSYTTYSRAADLPDGSTVLYGNGGSYASAWSVEVGEGTVYMLAYDWSGGRNAEWEWVLGAALSCNFPTISLDGTRSEVGFPETTTRTGSLSRTTLPAQASTPRPASSTDGGMVDLETSPVTTTWTHTTSETTLMAGSSTPTPETTAEHERTSAATSTTWNTEGMTPAPVPQLIGSSSYLFSFAPVYSVSTSESSLYSFPASEYSSGAPLSLVASSFSTFDGHSGFAISQSYSFAPYYSGSQSHSSGAFGSSPSEASDGIPSLGSGSEFGSNSQEEEEEVLKEDSKVMFSLGMRLTAAQVCTDEKQLLQELQYTVAGYVSEVASNHKTVQVTSVVVDRTNVTCGREGFNRRFTRNLLDTDRAEGTSSADVEVLVVFPQGQQQTVDLDRLVAEHDDITSATPLVAGVEETLIPDEEPATSPAAWETGNYGADGRNEDVSPNVVAGSCIAVLFVVSASGVFVRRRVVLKRQTQTKACVKLTAGEYQVSSQIMVQHGARREGCESDLESLELVVPHAELERSGAEEMCCRIAGSLQHEYVAAFVCLDNGQHQDARRIDSEELAARFDSESAMVSAVLMLDDTATCGHATALVPVHLRRIEAASEGSDGICLNLNSKDAGHWHSLSQPRQNVTTSPSVDKVLDEPSSVSGSWMAPADLTAPFQEDNSIEGETGALRLTPGTLARQRHSDHGHDASLRRSPSPSPPLCCTPTPSSPTLSSFVSESPVMARSLRRWGLKEEREEVYDDDRHDS